MKKIKFKHILAVILVYLFSVSSSFATTLPSKLQDVIKLNWPNANIRFDGLISLPDGTVYLPVLSSNPPKNAMWKITYTYPSKQKLTQLPEIVVFDSNYALMKVLKTSDGKLTVTDVKNIPFIVKTGLLPQDMLVPPGLIIPDDLKIMTGDLQIKLQNDKSNNILTDVKKDEFSSILNKNITPLSFMKNKTLLLTSIDSKSIHIFPSNSVVPTYSLKLESLPKFVQPVCNDKYLLVATVGKTYIDVADLSQEVIAKQIDLSYQPSEILISKDNSLAYVSVEDDSSIFVIDLNKMQLLERIKVKGLPKNISLSDCGDKIIYSDRNTGDIYTLALNNNYLNKYVYNASNISKMLLRGKNVYLLSRTSNELLVVDIELKDLIYKQKLSDKPTDMLLLDNKLYIISAVNELNVFDLDKYELILSTKVSETGFSKKIIKLQNADMLLITNIIDKKYSIYDIKANKVIQNVQTPMYIHDLKLINKKID